jgi:hypothetical protein
MQKFLWDHRGKSYLDERFQAAAVPSRLGIGVQHARVVIGLQ